MPWIVRVSMWWTKGLFGLGEEGMFDVVLGYVLGPREVGEFIISII